MIFLTISFNVHVYSCSVGLANPGEAFTVFYGERNPWCEYETHPQSSRFPGSVEGEYRRMGLGFRDNHPLSRQSRPWFQVCGEHCCGEAGERPWRWCLMMSGVFHITAVSLQFRSCKL